MRPRIDVATLVLGETGERRFNEFNEETEFGFRVRLDKLLTEGLKEVKWVSENLDVVEIIE
ncbi:MAG: hypothetical protein QXO01_03630 [Nitrososphaerota archaeon]